MTFSINSVNISNFHRIFRKCYHPIQPEWYDQKEKKKQKNKHADHWTLYVCMYVSKTNSMCWIPKSDPASFTVYNFMCAKGKRGWKREIECTKTFLMNFVSIVKIKLNNILFGFSEPSKWMREWEKEIFHIVVHFSCQPILMKLTHNLNIVITYSVRVCWYVYH